MATDIENGTGDDAIVETHPTGKTEKESFDDNHDDGHGHKMRSGQGWGKGIVADVKRTIGTHWKEEMINLNGKVGRRRTV